MMNKPKMSVEEALRIVSNVLANTNGNLADHQAMQMAVEVLRVATAKPDTEKEGNK